MRIIAVAAIAGLLVLVATALYWQHRLAPLTEAPGVKVTAEPMILPKVGPVRHVNLGFARFDLPAALTGELVEHGSSLFLTLRQADGQEGPLTICPLVSDREPAVQSLLAEYAKLADNPAPTYWELRKRALAAKPSSVWSALLHGRRAATLAGVLLMMKNIENSNTKRLEIHEDENVGITLNTKGTFVFIQIADKRAHAGQSFMLSPNTVDPHLIAAALVPSYRVTTTDFAPEHLTAQLRATGIARLATASAAAESADMRRDNQAQRLKALIDEVRAQRQAR